MTTQEEFESRMREFALSKAREQLRAAQEDTEAAKARRMVAECELRAAQETERVVRAQANAIIRRLPQATGN